MFRRTERSRSLRPGLAGLLALPLALACTARQPDAAPSGAPDPERWATLKAEIRERFPDVSQVSVPELATWLERADEVRPILLDARAPEEFAVSHLAGARLAPSLEQALEVLSDAAPDRPIVVYCSVGYRSSALAAQLARRGYADVRNLEGSLFEWANSGRALARDGGAATTVHPFDADWGRLLERELWSPLDSNSEP